MQHSKAAYKEQEKGLATTTWLAFLSAAKAKPCNWLHVDFEYVTGSSLGTFGGQKLQTQPLRILLEEKIHASYHRSEKRNRARPDASRTCQREEILHFEQNSDGRALPVRLKSDATMEPGLTASFRVSGMRVDYVDRTRFWKE